MHAVRILDTRVFFIALVIFNTHVFGGKYFLFGKRGDFNGKICTGSDVEFSVAAQSEIQCSFQCLMHQACITAFYNGENKTCTASSKFYNTNVELGDCTGTIGYHVDIDDCESNTCINSTCVDKVNGYTCVCPENYTESCDWRTYDLTEGYLEVRASSYGWGGRPEYALNGIKNGLHNTVQPCHHSDGSESYPWWEVTLKEPYNIRRLVITNRLEAQSYRFQNITIYVGGEVCATYPGPASWGQLTIEIRCAREDLFGQTVRIVKDGSILTLCEVELYVY